MSSLAAEPTKRGSTRSVLTLRHGTLSAYTHGRCRCPECTHAMTVYKADRREMARLGLIETDHGTVNGYTNHGCRCGACSAAMRSYRPKTSRVAARKW